MIFSPGWPTLAAVQKARPATLLKFFQAHHSVRAATNERRLAELKTALPLTTDGAVLNASLLMLKVLVAQLRPVLDAIADYDRHISTLSDACGV